MSETEQHEPPAPDPVSRENAMYEACVSEYTALRRGGASMLAAAAITAAHMYYVLSGQDQVPQE